jgi:hypothetical protein
MFYNNIKGIAAGHVIFFISKSVRLCCINSPFLCGKVPAALIMRAIDFIGRGLIAEDWIDA